MFEELLLPKKTTHSDLYRQQLAKLQQLSKKSTRTNEQKGGYPTILNIKAHTSLGAT